MALGGAADGGIARNAMGGFAGGLSSTGCGMPAGQALAQYATYTVHTTGVTLDATYTAAPADRDYAVWLPPTYNPATPYRTVFIASGCGSTPATETRYMNPDEGDQNAIYVGLAPYTQNNPSACFDNSGLKSVEWEYFAQAATSVEARFCVNRDDELIAGLRAGGTLANMMGCYFSKRDPSRTLGPDLMLRAQFSVASGLPMDLPPCAGPIAGFWMHDTNEINPPTDSITSLDRVLQLNGCTGSATKDWGASLLNNIGCKKYTDCPAEYPVVYCETTGLGRQSNYYGITSPALVQFTAELTSSQ
jgi:poly(3-hydroxybutyrate) depolymerase